MKSIQCRAPIVVAANIHGRFAHLPSPFTRLRTLLWFGVGRTLVA
jgi:hypothetical protein